MTYALWTIQGLLAALFLFAGAAKLFMPMPDDVPMPFPLAFLQFIGVAEIVGALGLVLPGLLRVHTYLTPLAAWGLAVIMIGATVTVALTMEPSAAIFPVIVGVLAALVAYGRSRGHRPAAVTQTSAALIRAS